MASGYTENRLSAANKRLLIRKVFEVDLYGVFCNIFLLWLLCNRCRLYQFSDLAVIYQQNTLILESGLGGIEKL